MIEGIYSLISGILGVSGVLGWNRTVCFGVYIE